MRLIPTKPNLREQTSTAVGARVLVTRDPGMRPAEAMILAENVYRPHLVKVRYVRSRAGAWIARSRIVDDADANYLP